MISSTGKGIRIDSEGDGNYGASRGHRRHNGIDELCKPNQYIVAKFDMYIDRISYPHKDKFLQGIKWTSGRSTGRMFYFVPFSELIGKDVKEGQKIGIAQSVSKYYGTPEMDDHIHFSVSR